MRRTAAAEEDLPTCRANSQDMPTLRRASAALLALGLTALPIAADGVGVSVGPLPVALEAAPVTYGPADLRLVEQVQVSEREIDLTFETPALAAPTTARVIVPEGFDPAAATRYPVLYLLHGGAGRYTDWANEGAVELTAGLPLITVLPDAGRSAWYTDWYNNGRRGTPMWETYHVDQLIPWIDAHVPTIAARHGRAITGLSSGGFGALSYASRNPDVFVAAAGFSGALDTNTPPVVAGKVIDGLAAQDRGGPGSLFGLRELEEVRWRGSNPWDLATNLRHTALTVRAGNGEAGGEFGGGGPTDPGGYFLEKATYDQSVSFHQRLDALDIDHLWDDYGAGTHNYEYWRRDLRLTLPDLMAVFAEQRPDPTSFSFRSIDAAYDVYGWDVALARPVVEFSSLEVSAPTAFAVSGTGTAAVRTPPVFRPGKRHGVIIDGVRSAVFADDTGRLTISVPLGPPNLAQQQFTPTTHESPATTTYRRSVTIDPPGRPSA